MVNCKHCQAEMELATNVQKGWEYYVCMNEECSYLQDKGMHYSPIENERLTKWIKN